jgi:polyisoprenoid-binding protein YceI
VVFDVEGPSLAQKDPWGNTRVGLSATARISRKNFGLTWNTALKTGGLLVGEAVTIIWTSSSSKSANQSRN